MNITSIKTILTTGMISGAITVGAVTYLNFIGAAIVWTLTIAYWIRKHYYIKDNRGKND